MEDSVTQRLNILVDTFENGVKSAFAKRIGISQQGAHDLLSSRKGGPSFKVLTSILENYPQIRMEWLVLGRGPMLQEETTPAASAPQEPLTTEQAKQALAATLEQVGGISAFIKEYMEAVEPELASEVKRHFLAGYSAVNEKYLRRTYHFGDEPTPGLEYDDRIANYLNLSKMELKEWMESPEFKDVPYTKIGSRMIVTERGLREFMGDLPKLS